MPEKIVLAYSGGLDTSIIIPWLKENYSYNVIAMVGDVGQGDDIDAVVERLMPRRQQGDRGGPPRRVSDGYVFPALRAVRCTSTIFLGTSLARPVIAKHQVEVALREGRGRRARLHGKGNDQVRFELTYRRWAGA